MKYITDTGTSYNFNFGEVPTYISLPVYVLTRPQNLVRVECEIGSVDIKDVGRLLFAITLDFDISRHHPVRVVPRTKDEKEYSIILQLVCPVDLINVGFITQTILYSLDLAGFYRDDLFRLQRSRS